MRSILGAGFIFWGLFLVFGLIVGAYLVWMYWREKRPEPGDQGIRDAGGAGPEPGQQAIPDAGGTGPEPGHQATPDAGGTGPESGHQAIPDAGGTGPDEAPR